VTWSPATLLLLSADHKELSDADVDEQYYVAAIVKGVEGDGSVSCSVPGLDDALKLARGHAALNGHVRQQDITHSTDIKVGQWALEEAWGMNQWLCMLQGSTVLSKSLK